MEQSITAGDNNLLEMVKRQKKILRDFPGHQSVMGVSAGLNHTYSLGGLLPM
jgi:hypothetical protein